MNNNISIDDLIPVNKAQDFIIKKNKDQYGYDAYEVHISTGTFNINYLPKTKDWEKMLSLILNLISITISVTVIILLLRDHKERMNENEETNSTSNVRYIDEPTSYNDEWCRDNR